jgi:hypothetical protein
LVYYQIFNPDFAVKFVLKLSNSRKKGVLGYFLGEEIALTQCRSLKVKMCSTSLVYKVFESCTSISIAKSGLKEKIKQ